MGVISTVMHPWLAVPSGWTPAKAMFGRLCLYDHVHYAVLHVRRRGKLILCQTFVAHFEFEALESSILLRLRVLVRGSGLPDLASTNWAMWPSQKRPRIDVPGSCRPGGEVSGDRHLPPALVQWSPAIPLTETVQGDDRPADRPCTYYARSEDPSRQRSSSKINQRSSSRRRRPIPACKGERPPYFENRKIDYATCRPHYSLAASATFTQSIDDRPRCLVEPDLTTPSQYAHADPCQP